MQKRYLNHLNPIMWLCICFSLSCHTRKLKVAQIPSSRAVKRNFKHSKAKMYTVPYDGLDDVGPHLGPAGPHVLHAQLVHVVAPPLVRVPVSMARGAVADWSVPVEAGTLYGEAGAHCQPVLGGAVLKK